MYVSLGTGGAVLSQRLVLSRDGFFLGWRAQARIWTLGLSVAHRALILLAIESVFSPLF